MFRALVLFLFLVVSSLKIVSAGILPAIPHELNFAYTGTDIKLEWVSTCYDTSIIHELKGTWIENNNKTYPLEDRDGNISDCAATVRLPRGGHWFIEVRACEDRDIVTDTFCSDWTSSKDSWEEEPIGWFLFLKPAPPSGGGITSGGEGP